MLVADPPLTEKKRPNCSLAPTQPETPATSAPIHALTPGQAAELLQVRHGDGLSADEVAARRRVYSLNRPAATPVVPLWRTALRQLSDVIVILLLLAAITAAWLGEWVDAAAVLAIVVINALLGVFQHYRAEKALSALAKLAAPTALVRRSGQTQAIDAADLVPGDCIELHAGDTVPADVRLIDGIGLQTQESALTGESTAVEKFPERLVNADAPPAERVNCAFSGTTVVTGKGSGIVYAIGSATELGRIGSLLATTERSPTPLEVRLKRLGYALVAICVMLVIVIAAFYVCRGAAWLDVFRLSIGLAVAAVPEGLPAAVTIALALGVQRMSRRRALVRNLAGVETLGSVTVICTDKTGTLTRNEMTVVEVRVGGGTWRVTGSGYKPHGVIERQDEAFELEGSLERGRREADLVHALRAGVLCNHARLDPSRDENPEFAPTGDPTEVSLISAALKRGIRREAEPVQVLDEIPFDSTRKAMSVLFREPNERRVVYTKGAVEYLLSRSVRYRDLGVERTLDAESRQAITEVSDSMAQRGLRVLGIAYRALNPKEGDRCREEELTFLGLFGIMDPPRDEAQTAVATCRRAGIRTIMITGDHRHTAAAVGRVLQIGEASHPVVTGEEMSRLSDAELRDAVGRTSIYARISPEQKLRIVRALQSRGEIVAMTGDGVNDAPAIKAADVGVAMGITGTQVTKEASTIVLLDDNFATIVGAVAEGRTIYENIRRFILYLLAGNAGKLILMLTAAVLGLREPLLALQILWLNLVTDGLPALALGVEPVEGNAMQRCPRPPATPLIGTSDLPRILFPAVMIAAAALLGFGWILFGDELQLSVAQTAAFAIMGFGQLAFALTCRSRVTRWAFRIPLPLIAAVGISAALQFAAVTLPGFRECFGVHGSIDAQTWLIITLLSLAPAVVWEVVAFVRQKHSH